LRDTRQNNMSRIIERHGKRATDVERGRHRSRQSEGERWRQRETGRQIDRETERICGAEVWSALARARLNVALLLHGLGAWVEAKVRERHSSEQIERLTGIRQKKSRETGRARQREGERR